MNEKQKKISKIFLFLACSILLCITGIIAFALYQKQLSTHGDVFDKVVAEQYMIWISPSIVVLIGFSITGLLLYFGLWKILKNPSK